MTCSRLTAPVTAAAVAMALLVCGCSDDSYKWEIDPTKPYIALSDSTLSFVTDTGAGDPAAQTFTVANSAAGTGTMIFTVSPNVLWIVVLPLTPVTTADTDPPVLFTVTVQTTSTGEAGKLPLVVGTYTAVITVSASGPAANIPQQIVVTMRIDPIPHIELNGDPTVPLSITIPLNATGPVSRTVTLITRNSGPMNWTVSNVTTTDGQPWLSVSPMSGVLPIVDDSVTLTVDVDRTVGGGQPVGVYTGTIEISSPEADNSPQILDVTMTVVVADAEIGVNPTLFIVDLPEGKGSGVSSIDLTLTLDNIAGDPNSILDWTITSDQTWLTTDLTAGTTNAGDSVAITVTVDATALTEALSPYTGTLTISDPNARMNGLTVIVTLNVVLPTIATSTSALTFSGEIAGFTPQPQNIFISNIGLAGSQLDWTITLATTSGGSWLLASPSSGTTTTGSALVTVSIDPTVFAGLATGTYDGTITIDDPLATTTPLIIPVTMTIGQRDIVVNEVNGGTWSWVEVYNPTSLPVTLTGWRLQFAFTASVFIFPSFVLPAFGYVVVAESTVTVAPVIFYTPFFIGFNSGTGSVSLLDNSLVGVDFVRWGTNLDPPPVGTPWTGTSATAFSSFSTLGRDQFSTDTDTPFDWSVTAFATPGSANNIATGGDIYEPDNFFGQASTITFGASQSRSIHIAGDLDYVAFTVTFTRTVNIRTTGATGWDTELYLYNSIFTNIAYNDDGGTPFRYSSILMTLNPGTYYIVVTDYNNSIIPLYFLSLN